MAGRAARSTQLCPEQMNCGGWEVRGQEDEATSCSEEGTCSWCGLAWFGRQEGQRTQQGGLSPASCKHGQLQPLPSGEEG